MAVIRGPFASGTSTACCQRIWQHAVEQNRSLIDGQRRSRWAVVRDTYPRLETTALATWVDWFPEKQYGKLFTGGKPWTHQVRVGDIELDVLFLALEGDKAIGDLLSLELTGLWFNELESIPLNIFSSALARTGRYPKVLEGGSTWDGMIADMNAPPENHWLPMMMGEAPLPEDMSPGEEMQYVRSEGWAYFVQPGAMVETKDVTGRITGYEVNPKAENLKFLKQGYYKRAIQGKTKRWIDAYILNRIVALVDGEAVWKQFNPDVHVASAPLEVIKDAPVYVGMDFGRRPAAVFGQQVHNRWLIQHEAIGKDMSSTRFAPIVQRVLQAKYPGCEVKAFGDPKGADRTQAGETTSYDVFKTHGIFVRPAPVKQNHIQTRIDVVDFVLTTTEQGLPRFLMSPDCRMLKSAMAGGYRYPKEKPGVGEDRQPIKDRWSDVCDALQYLILGGGEGRVMTGLMAGGNAPKPVQVSRPKSRRRFVA